MLFRWCLVLPGLLACGRYGFTESELAIDATSDRTVECWDRWKSGAPSVGAPERIRELAGPKQSNPSISSDGLTLYFERKDASSDLYAAQRTALEMPWGAAKRIDALATSSNEGRLSASTDGMFAVFTSSRGGNSDLWTTRRDSPAAAFGEPTQDLVESLMTSKAELDPELSSDGTRIYYAPYADGTQDIRMAKRVDGAFMLANVFEELQISTAVADPALSPDETVIAFSSGATSAKNDLYFAVRADRGAAFGTPKLIPGINLQPDTNDGDIDLSSNGCEIYFMSDRAGIPELYVARVD